MDTQRTEGIILQAINFQDYDQILTVFSREEGMLKFIFKGANSPKRTKGAVTSPLTRAEFVYTKGKGDLYNCREVSIINQYLSLRQNLTYLEAACDLVLTLQKTQLTHKPAPDLYALLVSYLEKIPVTKDPRVLSASFRLKLLRHEGLYGFEEGCTACQTPLSTFYIARGETFCKMHAPPKAIVFDKEEAAIITHLAFSRSLSQLVGMEMTPLLNDKIKQFFDEQFD